jgi:hypothetical protein
MSEEERESIEGVVRAAVGSGNVTLGEQSFEYASVQIQVEDAAHQRRVEQQRLDHEREEQR